MRVCHVLESLHPKAGGPALVMVALAAEQQLLGQQPQVFCPEIDGWPAVQEFIQQTVGDQFVPIFRQSGNAGGPMMLFARDKSCLGDGLTRAEVLHCHGLWAPIVMRAARSAMRRRTPYIVRPAGMLEPWSLTQKAWKKKVALCLGVNRVLRKAAALHATSISEARQFRSLKHDNPIAVIPNGVDGRVFETPPDASVIERQWPQLAGCKRLLFMSRIHPKKGLLELARCWGELHQDYSDWHLLIAGPAEDGYLKQVQQELRQSAADRQTAFLGPLFGELKTQVLLNSDVFVLPTFSENFGVVIAEAMAAGLPVITTTGTPWSELDQHACGWWIDLDHQTLSDTLQAAMNKTDAQRARMGARGKQVIAERYAWPVIAKETVELYQWLVDGGDRPAFVFDREQPIPPAD